MKQLAFITKGKMDLRSFSHFGFSSKPETTTPIGVFGTGLKYAVAILNRFDSPLRVIVNGKEYTFHKKKTVFRGKDFFSLHMQIRGVLGSLRNKDLPYSTELGKNWEKWQALRELVSNTLDENGEMKIIPSGSDLSKNGLRGHTVILIEDQEIVRLYEEELDSIFLPKDRHRLMVYNTYLPYTRGLEVLEGNSKYIYYNGIRIYELEKPTLFTYNLLGDSELTEDRTMKHTFLIQSRILESVSSWSNDMLERLILCEEQFYEAHMNYQPLSKFGERFNELITKARFDRKELSAGIQNEINRHLASLAANKKSDFQLFITKRDKWKIVIKALLLITDTKQKVSHEFTEEEFNSLVEFIEELRRDFSIPDIREWVEFNNQEDCNETLTNENVNHSGTSIDGDIPF